MKIVEVIPSLSKKAGAEVFLMNLSASFKKNGNIITVICLYDGIDKDIELFFRKNAIQYYTCGKRKRLDIQCSKKFKSLILSLKPNIVHMHLNCIATFFLAFKFSKTTFKSVLTIHNLYKKDFKKSERFLIRAYSHLDKIKLIGIADDLTNDIKSVLKKVEVETIYNGTQLFHPILNEELSDVISILNVAAFREQKNQLLLLNACNKLCKISAYKLSLFFVGEGPLKSYIMKQAENNDLIETKFIGQVNNVEPFLDKATIFCLSSNYEGNPISILEAMSVGLPIVAPRVGGIPNVVKNEINGLLFTPNNESELIQSLIALINDKKKRDTIRANNIEESKKYSIDLCARKYLSVFNDLLEKYENK